MFPLKRSEDQSVTTEVSNRPSQTHVAGSGVEQVTGTDDHSNTATYAADCGPATDESLDTSQLQRLETKQEKWRETHGLGLEIREMMQGMGREMRQDMGREIRDMRRENGALRLEMRQEMCEMQKEMSEMQLKVQDIATTASYAVISNLATASGRSTEEGLHDVTTQLTDTGTILFLSGLLHMLFFINAQIKYNKIKVNGGI